MHSINYKENLRFKMISYENISGYDKSKEGVKCMVCNYYYFEDNNIQTNNRLKNYFRFKDFVPEALRSSLIYKFSCGSCTASYIGKTYRQFKVRVSEHQGVSPRTGKPVKGTLSTSVMDHMLVCDHKVVHEDFKLLGNESDRYLLELKESLFIERDKPSLNKNLHSQELLLF